MRMLSTTRASRRCLRVLQMVLLLGGLVQLSLEVPQSQMVSPPVFRGSRTRPADQQALTDRLADSSTKQQTKPVKSRALSHVDEGSFPPMSPSIPLGPIQDLHNAPSKSHVDILDRRKSATARTIHVGPDSPNAFRFPTAAEVDEAPQDLIPARPKSYHLPAPQERNATSRFFTFNTNRQALDLGLSFTVPFVSIPMSSLVNIGETTSSALSSLFSFNWSSVAVVGLLLGAATLLLPTIIEWVSGVLLAQNALSSQYGRIPDGYDEANPVPSSYGQAPSYYSRSINVSPFTSLLEQLDDAFAQYDLDATSCMQRVVCSYVSDAEDSVARGGADPMQLIINGLSKSSWTHTFMGQSAFSKAVEVGKRGASCQQQYPKCPFSLASVLKFLANYATFT